MTQEEKAKVYLEDLKKAKDLIEKISTELKESEDEKMMSRIIDGFKNYSRSASKWNNIPVEEVIAYLEKQKEQKPYEPKNWPADKNNLTQEQKPIEWTELTWKDINELEEIMNEVHSDYRGGGIGQKSFGLEVLERFRYIKGDELDIKEQKPAEWSEDDEKKRNLLIDILKVNHPNGYFKVNPANTLNMEAIHVEELVDWLKSLHSKHEIHKEKTKEPKHTEVWLEGRTIFEQDANTFVNPGGEPEAKLTGWVARDREYNPYFGLGLVLFNEKPKRTGNCWSGEIASQLPWRLFPDLKWEDEPIEVEITIKRK